MKLISMNDTPDINDPPLMYWQSRKYSEQNVVDVCNAVNHQLMVALVQFKGRGAVDVTVSKKTWERQEGHYPTVAKFFTELAARPKLRDRRGCLVVWLEDGLWDWQQEHSWNAPTLSFGRHIYDNHTFVIPDPAYVGSRGYQSDIENIRSIENGIGFENKIRTVFFRGAAVGLGIEGDNWKNTARGRLSILSRDMKKPEILDAKMTKMNHLPESQQKVLVEAGVIGEYIPFKDFLRYLYLIHADGYCCSWPSLFTKLACDSVTVRILGEYEQWYYRDLTPWRHYVPLRPDLADFDRVYQWLISNDQAVRDIISEAHSFLEKRLNYERCAAETEDLCARILDCER